MKAGLDSWQVGGLIPGGVHEPRAETIEAALSGSDELDGEALRVAGNILRAAKEK